MIEKSDPNREYLYGLSEKLLLRNIFTQNSDVFADMQGHVHCKSFNIEIYEYNRIYERSYICNASNELEFLVFTFSFIIILL